MIEERAVVVAVDKGCAWVETRRRSACGSCEASGGCGTAVLAKFWSKTQQVRVMTTTAVEPGDAVMIGLAEGALLRGALLVYLLPLVLLLAGALLGQAVFSGAGEEPLILMGALGLGLGLWVTRTRSRRIQNDARFQPVILRRLSSEYVGMTESVSCPKY